MEKHAGRKMVKSEFSVEQMNKFSTLGNEIMLCLSSYRAVEPCSNVYSKVFPQLCFFPCSIELAMRAGRWVRGRKFRKTDTREDETSHALSQCFAEDP